MVATYIISSAIIDTVVYDDVELVDCAETGAVGTGHITVRDDDGAINIIGLRPFSATENDCGNEITMKGNVGTRTFSRGTMEAGNARLIEVEIKDKNDLLGYRALRGNDAKRPRETVGDRLRWLLTTPELGDLVIDAGRVHYSGKMIDEADHRKTYPGDVLAECAIAAGGHNYYVYTDEASGDSALCFRDDNAASSNTSLLRISNDPADFAISSNTLIPGDDTRLTRDPTQIYSRVAVPYARGTEWVDNGATASNYRRRDGIAPTAHVKRAAKAIEIGEDYLETHSTEEDIIECPIPQVRSDQVNLVHAGDRIAAKFTHFTTEGYGSFTYFRVLERKVRPLLRDKAPALYEMDLKLSPQETCSDQPTFVQYNGEEMDAQVGGGQPNWTWRAFVNQNHTTASTAGNLIVLAFLSNDLNSGTLVSVPTGWSSTFINRNMKADNTGDWCHIIYKVSSGESYVDVQMTGSVRGPVYMFLEYADLISPTQSGSFTTSRQVGLGYADAAASAYPSGAAAVLAVCFMHTGPESGDALSVSGTGLTLRTPQDSGGNPGGYPAFFGSPSIGVGDMLRAPGASAGTTSGWQFQFTNDEETMVNVVSFTGLTC